MGGSGYEERENRVESTLNRMEQEFFADVETQIPHAPTASSDYSLEDIHARFELAAKKQLGNSATPDL
ncbi:hypothetical protein Ciccas_013422 [Cichlidogyrus casuarinus]|uniref:Uncharacterized protein n=1 Tax=Cichlidogyrus casuarinus TaxID=1844966 RepID=A0ABD2PNP8_9PLAT